MYHFIFFVNCVAYFMRPLFHIIEEDLPTINLRILINNFFLFIDYVEFIGLLICMKTIFTIYIEYNLLFI